MRIQEKYLNRKSSHLKNDFIYTARLKLHKNFSSIYPFHNAQLFQQYFIDKPTFFM